MFAPYSYLDKNSGGTLGVKEKNISPSAGLPLGIGSAFAAIPPSAPVPLDQRPPDSLYPWEATRLHSLPPPTHSSLTHLSPTLELSPLQSRLGTAHLGLQQAELSAPHPTYRIPHYMEHLYQSLHTPPQTSLRGLSPLERSSLALSNDYLGMSGIAATRLSDPLMLPGSLTSTDLAFSIDGSRLASPRPSIRQSRKRALSSSPYSDSFDINSMIRFSPNSLVSIMNGSRSSSASGSYGHLSAGAISPALGVPPSMGAAQSQLQQLQAHIMRGAPMPGSPFLAPSPLLQHSPSIIPPHQNIFSLTSQPQPLQHPHPIKPLCEKKDLPSQMHEENKHKKDHPVAPVTSAPIITSRPSVGHEAPPQHTVINEDDNMKEEPDDFIETNCNWKECSKEFNTQDELVKHINNDHIHANKKSFVCRWKDCSRDEKPFKAQYMLVVHMRRHTGEKPHRCTFEGCFKAYSRLENLKTHLRSHTGEKPYMCEYPGCTKAFSNASDRAKHQNRTHSNEKPYVCKAPGCTKRYTDPSSLRKHVKTVHGADFYASKKHKGNDHPNNQGNNGGNPPSKDRNSDSSPRSDAGKGGSLSSPSVKSEQDPTSPSQDQSPAMGVGIVPMDQSRMFDAPISDANISTTYDVPLVDDWDQVEDDLDPTVDLPMGHMNGNGSLLTSTAGIHERNLRNRLKVRLQTKGLTNILPNVPGTSRKSGTGLGDLSHKINQMKVNGTYGGTQLDGRKSNIEYPPKSTQTLLTNNRRDSNSTVSTYYGSMKSDSSHPVSRRGSEMSQVSCNSLGRPGMGSSLYDPISIGSSRRSSEVSNYMSNSPSTMASQLTAQLNRQTLGTPDCYNTSNLVLQTQNMSLSQDNLQNSQWSNGVNSNPAIDQSNSGYFGAVGPLGPPTTNQVRDGSRRSSDPGRSLDRGFNDPSQRMQRYNSYYNCSYRGQFGMRPLMTPPIYNNNQGLQNNQNGDIKVENKDRTATPNSMYNQSHLSSPMYPSQNMGAPYSNQNMSTYHSMMSPNSYQYPQQSPGYSAPVGQNMNYSQSMVPPAQQQFPGNNTQSINPTGFNQQFPKNNNINNGYGMQNSQGIPSHNAQFAPQYNAGNTRAFTPNSSFNMSQPQPRLQNGIPNGQAPSYGLGSVNYGCVHVCGHLAAPNLPVSAYQSPCSGCQGRVYPGYDNSQYQQAGDWSANTGVSQTYNGQYAASMGDNNNPHLAYQDPMNSFNPTLDHSAINGAYPNNVPRDVQCQDVSQSTQSRLADAAKLISSPEKKSPNGTCDKDAATPKNILIDAASQDPKTPVVNSNPEEDSTKKAGSPKAEDKESQNGYMKSDTYKRTLEYVQQCQTWSNSPVKEEVTSTTDQKPKLNSAGGIIGYNLSAATAVTPADMHTMTNMSPPGATSFHVSSFNTPLPQVPNMVVNDLSSSLTSLQKENKYLQLLQ